jgi:hypothetical protein
MHAKSAVIPECALRPQELYLIGVQPVVELIDHEQLFCVQFGVIKVALDMRLNVRVDTVADFSAEVAIILPPIPCRVECPLVGLLARIPLVPMLRNPPDRLVRPPLGKVLIYQARDGRDGGR